MYLLTRLMNKQQLFAQQLPTAGLAMVLAELFYKFHSFTLECLAFLATWYVLDALASLLFSNRLSAQNTTPQIGCPSARPSRATGWRERGLRVAR